MTAIHFREERLELFPTHVFKRQYEGLDALNEKLRRFILDREGDEEGVVLSNVGGWHSRQDLLLEKHPAITVLLSLVQDAVHAFVAERLGRDPATFSAVLKVEGWANVIRRGNYARPHVHPSSNFAVVYYVDAGDAPPSEAGKKNVSGVLEVLDPRQRPEMFQSAGVDARDSVAFLPSTGQMLVFPSWLYHYVHPYQGDRPRVSIACNVSVVELRETRREEQDR